MFALGCVLAELVTLHPLMPGLSELDQLNKICETLGTPTKKQWPEGYI
jgi:hypothetical protein